MKDNYLRQELYELIQTDETAFDFLQKGALDGIWYWDLVHPENEWMSPEFWHTFGYDPETKTHSPSEWQDMINQDDLKLALQNFEKHLKNPLHRYDQVVRYTHAAGHTVWVRCRGIAIRDEDGVPVRMLGAHNDVTPIKRMEKSLAIQNEELKKKNEEINRLYKMLKNESQLDHLTRAFNRSYIDSQIIHELERFKRSGSKFCLAMLDIDKFKTINDEHGHPTGDKVLVHFVMLLKSVLRAQDIVSRWGGDEFMVLLPDTDLVAARNAIQRVNDRNSGVAIDKELILDYNFSVGIYEIESTDDYEAVVQKVDTLLYVDKEIV